MAVASTVRCVIGVNNHGGVVNEVMIVKADCVLFWTKVNKLCFDSDSCSSLTFEGSIVLVVGME